MTSPVSIAEALDHLRLGQDVTVPEADEVSRMVQAATDWTEAFCKRAWMAGTKVSTFDSFPASYLPRTQQGLLLCGGVVSSVTTVTYYDADYVEQTMPQADYRLVVGTGRSKLFPGFGKYWPTSSADEPGHITVTYVVGETNYENVPAAVRQAILLIVGSLYEYREQGVIDNSGVALVNAPVAAEKLLFPYKLRH